MLQTIKGDMKAVTEVQSTKYRLRKAMRAFDSNKCYYQDF